MKATVEPVRPVLPLLPNALLRLISLKTFMLIEIPDSMEINTTNEKFRTLFEGILKTKMGSKKRYSSSQARMTHVANAKAPARAM
ncbi:MAG: hypothetical protein HYY67_07910 [Thaumarchaeota archaeon]|nr:hypothetical protein [Nitrososphaerota archaeon]